MRLWVTRTLPGAEETARRLRDLGHEPIVRPVLAASRVSAEPPDLDKIGAVAFSSGAGVRAFAEISRERSLPVFTTGDATAAEAREAGFGAVHSAWGDLPALARLVASHRPSGEVLWPCAAEPAGDLAAMLAPAGVGVRRLVLYRTVPCAFEVPDGLDGVLIHSPRAARILADRLSAPQSRGLSLFAISPAAAAPLSHLPFADVAVAPRPDETALLGLLGA